MRSIEDILRDTTPESHKVQEPKSLNGVNRVISGKEVHRKDLGHRTWGQTIHHNMEHRNDLRSSVFKVVSGSVTLEPSKLGAYSLKINGNTTVTLQNPYRIPTDQGSQRTRFWNIRCRFYYGTGATLTWPSNVRIPAGGVLPGSPGVSGTSDVFDLIYDERSGEWFVGMAILGAVSDDPEVADPNAVINEDGPGDRSTGGGDDVEPGDSQPSGTSGYPSDSTPSTPGTTTDHPYDRPVELPAGGQGDILALHADGFSFSRTGGAAWGYRSLQNLGTLKDIVGIDTGRIWVHNTDGEVYTAQTLTSEFIKIDFDDVYSAYESDIFVQNGDFETGDLEGWTQEIGSNVQVSNTAFPLQIPGSSYYLSKNWRADDNEAFSVSQEIIANTEYDNVKVSVSAYSSYGAVARLRVEAERGYGENGNTIATPTGNKDFNNGMVSDFAVSTRGEYLNLHLISGSANGINGQNGQDGTRVLELRYQDGTPFDGLWSISLGDLDFFEEVRIETSKIEEIIHIDGNSVSVANVGSDTAFSGNSDNQSICIVLNHQRISLYLDLLGSGVAIHHNLTGQINEPAGAVAEYTAESTEYDQWETLTVNIPDYNGNGFKIYLESDTFNQSDYILFDNVIAKSVGSPDISAVSAIAWTQRGADMYLDDSVVTGTNVQRNVENTGFSDVLSASSNGLFKIAYNGQEIKTRVAEVEGWETALTINNITSLVAGPINAAFSVDGTLYEFDKALGVEINNQTIFNNDYLLSADYFRHGVFLTSETDGTVRFYDGAFEDWAQQPVNTDQSHNNYRRSLPLDSGRVLGWDYGSRDLYYTNSPTSEWKLGGALYKPILKIVEIK